MFPVVFDHMTGYLLVAEVFTGAVLLTNGAWIQAALLWCSLTPAIVAFRRLCVCRYLRPLDVSARAGERAGRWGPKQ